MDSGTRDNGGLRILHAIHDFLPRHQAGSELYALALCRALEARHHVTLLASEFDPARRHGQVTWRVCDGLPVAEVVNNWVCRSFEETYRPPVVGARVAQILGMVQPDVVHVHSLLNLSFDLPAEARARGIPVVATLHDYSLVCPSGGQRVHRAEGHVCAAIDPIRCSRCFRESPFFAQASFGALVGAAGTPSLAGRAARSAVRRIPGFSQAAAALLRRAPLLPVSASQIERRLDAATRVFDDIDLFVAPSASIAAEFVALGLGAERVRVSAYGIAAVPRRPRVPSTGPLRLGYVGTLVWHKGVHVLIDALAHLHGLPYEVKIFGNPDVFPDYTSDLRARSRGVPVQWMGPFARDAVGDVYAQIDALVVPSLWLENSPLVVHEALAAGVPVVASRIGGLAELVAHDRTGLLCEPGAAQALADAIRRLIDEPSLLDRLSVGARSVAAPKSADEDAREWEAAYAGVLERRRSSGRSE